MLCHSSRTSFTCFPRFSWLCVGYLYLLLISSVAPEKVSLGTDNASLSGTASGANASVKTVHKNETPEKIQTPPPLVEVVHGKQMNSVAHDILGSIDEMPPFVTEVFNVKTDKVSSHTEYNTLKSKLAEDNVTGVETLLEQALLVGPPTADNTTQAAPVIPSIDGIRRPLEVPSPLDVDHLSPEPPAIPTQPSSLPKKNDTDHHDEIPSFNEWANKKMAEVEKNKGENHTVGTPKIRLKNYASPDCGAKVVGSNPEAVSPSAILSPSRDDYMLNPCNVKIWFVVELCESIQPQRVEIANFELFSSSPHNLSLWVSDRYPSREWSLVAVVQAKDERNVQSFPLPRLPHFAKYVKVELHSHYGSEHYCPVSLFKAYGTSELEVLDSSDNDGDDGDEVPPDGRTSVFEEGDESLSKLPDAVKGTPTKEEKKTGDDIFRTAKAAVLSIVQKAAQVLGNGGARNNSCLNVTTSSQCLTPGYQVVCNDCSDQFYYRLYDIMCCNGGKLKALLENHFVYSVVTQSPLCSTIGLEFSTKNCDLSESSSSKLAIGVTYLRALLGEDTLAALCNYLAISKRKAALNVSQDKANVEEVPLGEDQSMANETIDVPTPAQPVDSSQLEIEPTVSRLEPEITISPTKTIPAERDYPEASHVKNVDPKADLKVLNTKEVPSGEIENNIPEEEETELANTTSSPEIISPVEPIPTQPETEIPLALQEPAPLPAPPVETVQQPAPSQDEPLTVDSLALDSLFPEMEEETQSQGTTAKATAVNNPPVQKESVFVRLANRIKALEVNMSLSSQYLEELSRRYKKQVEELQRTLAGMVEERRLASERETMHAAQLTLLTQKTEALTAAVTQLLEERNQWGPKAYIFGHHGIIMLVEVAVLFLALGCCRWLMGRAKSTSDPVRAPVPPRRHSVDAAPTSPLPKKRRPSEEALIPSSATHQELMIDGAKRKISKDGKQKKKRRRKDKLEDGMSVVSADSEEFVLVAPDFIRTADWSRRQRASIQTQTSSSQETLSAPPSTNSSIKKKTGALKKMVKKLF